MAKGNAKIENKSDGDSGIIASTDWMMMMLNVGESNNIFPVNCIYPLHHQPSVRISGKFFNYATCAVLVFLCFIPIMRFDLKFISSVCSCWFFFSVCSLYWFGSENRAPDTKLYIKRKRARETHKPIRNDPSHSIANIKLKKLKNEWRRSTRRFYKHRNGSFS